MSNKLPWDERVTMLSINPDAARREDVAKMAADLIYQWEYNAKLRECHCPHVFDTGAAMEKEYGANHETQ